MAVSPAAYVNATAAKAAATTSQIATIVAMIGGRAKIIRNGQRSPDTTTYPVTEEIAATLGPGDVVSVLKSGASYLVIAKLTTTTTPPPPIVTPPTSTGIYTGVYSPNLHNDTSLTEVGAFETAAGKHAAIVSTARDWNAFGALNDGGMLDRLDGHGAVPLLFWMPQAFGAPSLDPMFTLAEIVAGSFDSYLSTQAAALASFNKPLFLCFAPDPNANDPARPWQGDPLYVQAYRYVHDHIAGTAPLVLWVWSVRAWQPAGLLPSDPEVYYPGDAYVNWIGLSGYNSVPLGGAWKTFSEVFQFAYGQLQSAHPVTIPFMLPAWGCDADARKAAWFTDALTALPTFFPLVKAEVYEEETQTAALGLGADWPIASPAAAATAFRAGLASTYYLSAVS